MTYEEIYKSKLMSAEDAVESQVKSGDKIAIGGLALADKVLKAVISDVKAGRLEDISLFGNLITSDIGLDDEDIPKDKFSRSGQRHSYERAPPSEPFRGLFYLRRS